MIKKNICLLSIFSISCFAMDTKKQSIEPRIIKHLEIIQEEKEDFFHSWLQGTKKWKFTLARAMMLAPSEKERNRVEKLIDDLTNPELKETIRTAIEQKLSSSQ
jgi:hypothetical protein